MEVVGIDALKGGKDVDVENEFSSVPYHPQVQFLKDVDGDGEIDHLYCCEAAVLEYYNNISDDEMTPIDMEREDTLVEYRRIAGYGPDAGLGAPIMAILFETEPIVYGPKRMPIMFGAVYRVPIKSRNMLANKIVVNHDLLVIGYGEDCLYLHCTYNGVAKVSKDEFDRSCLAISTVIPHDEPKRPMRPSETAEYVMEKTEAPVVATVNAKIMNVEERTGTVPFVVSVEKSWVSDWKEGLQQDRPRNRDDLICYIAAVVEKDKFLVYNESTDDWIKWLKKNEKKILLKG